jgi:hypothetical protein
MKIRYCDTEENIELHGNTFDVYSAERVDVRPNETIQVRTDYEYLAYKKDHAVFKSAINKQVMDMHSGRGYSKLLIPIKNNTDSTKHIYEGDHLGTIRWAKSIEFTTEAQLVEPDSIEQDEVEQDNTKQDNVEQEKDNVEQNSE